MIGRFFMVVGLLFLLLCASLGAMVLGYMWLIWYASLRDSSDREERSSEGNRKPQKQQGLSAADLQRLPTVECGKEENGGERSSGSGGGANAECAVCLEVFESGDRCRVIPACSHVFHVDCADAWLSKRSVCPICRRSAACEGDERNSDNDSAAAAAAAAESIVVDMPIAISPADYRG